MTLFFGFLPNTGFVDEYPEEYILQTARVIAPQDAAQVVLNDITVTAMLKVQKTEVSTVGGSFLAPFTKTEQEKKKLLDGITTVFSPKHLCVIVGPPQCGKSTLLRLVAGQLDKNLERTGDMLYNGRKMPTQLLQRMASYTSQIDQHLPSLTVGETLDFSSECTNNRFTKRFAKTAAAEKVGLSAKQQMNNGHTPTTEFFLKKYHLDHVENSGIGDDMTRGVSGGEKKRVTVAEMKMSPAIIECADEITTGLDSSVTVEMMKLNKVQTKLMKKTLIVSLLQPPAAALAQATEILMLAEGHLIFHAPLHEMEAYFAKRGFTRPPNVSVADFIVDMCTDERASYYDPIVFMPPAPNAGQLSQIWYQCTLFRNYIKPRLDGEFSTKYDDSLPEKNCLFRYQYGAKWIDLVWLNVKKHLKLIIRDKNMIVRLPIQTMFLSLMMGHIFWQSSSGIRLVGAMFMLIIMWTFVNWSLLAFVIERRSVFYKQVDAHLYSTTSYCVGEFLASVPSTLIAGVVWLATFFMIGMDLADLYWYYLYYLANSWYIQTFLRFCTSIQGSHSGAQGVAIGFVILFITFSGYFVTYDQQSDWISWMTGVMPFYWLKKNLANKIFGLLARCEFWLKSGWVFRILWGMSKF